MKRIGLVLSAAALMAAITAFSSVSAFAQEPPCTDDNPSGPGGRYGHLDADLRAWD